MSSHNLRFRQLEKLYAIVRLSPSAAVPEWATPGEFTSISRTSDELSIVCAAEQVPPDIPSPHHWTCMKLEGPFPFSQTGVLLSFIRPLSENNIPIFAISTYDTDYVLIQTEFTNTAFEVLRKAGHQLLTT